MTGAEAQKQSGPKLTWRPDSSRARSKTRSALLPPPRRLWTTPPLLSLVLTRPLRLTSLVRETFHSSSLFCASSGSGGRRPGADRQSCPGSPRGSTGEGEVEGSKSPCALLGSGGAGSAEDANTRSQERGLIETSGEESLSLKQCFVLLESPPPRWRG